MWTALGKLSCKQHLGELSCKQHLGELSCEQRLGEYHVNGAVTRDMFWPSRSPVFTAQGELTPVGVYWHHCIMTPVYWHLCAMTPVFCDMSVPWYMGTMTPAGCDTSAPWYLGTMTPVYWHKIAHCNSQCVVTPVCCDARVLGYWYNDAWLCAHS